MKQIFLSFKDRPMFLLRTSPTVSARRHRTGRDDHAHKRATVHVRCRNWLTRISLSVSPINPLNGQRTNERTRARADADVRWWRRIAIRACRRPSFARTRTSTSAGTSMSASADRQFQSQTKRRIRMKKTGSTKRQLR